MNDLASSKVSAGTRNRHVTLLVWKRQVCPWMRCWNQFVVECSWKITFDVYGIFYHLGKCHSLIVTYSEIDRSSLHPVHTPFIYMLFFIYIFLSLSLLCLQGAPVEKQFPLQVYKVFWFWFRFWFSFWSFQKSWKMILQD